MLGQIRHWNVFVTSVRYYQLITAIICCRDEEYEIVVDYPANFEPVVSSMKDLLWLCGFEWELVCKFGIVRRNLLLISCIYSCFIKYPSLSIIVPLKYICVVIFHRLSLDSFWFNKGVGLFLPSMLLGMLQYAIHWMSDNFKFKFKIVLFVQYINIHTVALGVWNPWWVYLTLHIYNI